MEPTGQEKGADRPGAKTPSDDTECEELLEKIERCHNKTNELLQVLVDQTATISEQTARTGEQTAQILQTFEGWVEYDKKHNECSLM